MKRCVETERRNKKTRTNMFLLKKKKKKAKKKPGSFSKDVLSSNFGEDEADLF